MEALMRLQRLVLLQTMEELSPKEFLNYYLSGKIGTFTNEDWKTFLLKYHSQKEVKSLEQHFFPSSSSPSHSPSSSIDYYLLFQFSLGHIFIINMMDEECEKHFDLQDINLFPLTENKVEVTPPQVQVQDQDQDQDQVQDQPQILLQLQDQPQILFQIQGQDQHQVLLQIQNQPQPFHLDFLDFLVVNGYSFPEQIKIDIVNYKKSVEDPIQHPVYYSHRLLKDKFNIPGYFIEPPTFVYYDLPIIFNEVYHSNPINDFFLKYERNFLTFTDTVKIKDIIYRNGMTLLLDSLGDLYFLIGRDISRCLLKNKNVSKMIVIERTTGSFVVAAQCQNVIYLITGEELLSRRRKPYQIMKSS